MPELPLPPGREGRGRISEEARERLPCICGPDVPFYLAFRDPGPRRKLKLLRALNMLNTAKARLSGIR